MNCTNVYANVYDQYGLTDLYIAVKSNDITGVTQALHNGADPNKRIFGTILPIHCAVANKNHIILQLLIASGATVDIVDTHYFSIYSILHNAVYSSECLKVLLTVDDIDALVKNHYGYTPLDNAVSINNINSVKLLLESILYE